MQKKGNKYGVHRVIEPQGLLTQAAKKIDNTMECWSNEILCDVSALNLSLIHIWWGPQRRSSPGSCWGMGASRGI